MELVASTTEGDELLLREDRVVEGFSEYCEYFIAMPAEHLDAVLLIDEERLPRDPQQHKPCWAWRPGCYAGQVQAELRSAAGKTLATYLLDVSPDAAKLGREQFAAMVEELRDYDPRLLIGTEPPRITTGASGAFSSPNLEYGRLRAYGEQFVRALEQVAQRPLKRLRHRREVVAPHQVRHVDQGTLSALTKSPRLAALITGVQDFQDTGPLTLDVPSVDESIDIAANHVLLYFLRAVLARVRRVHEALKQDSDISENTARTALGRRLPERSRFLRKLEFALRRISNRSPFCSLTRAEVSTAGLNALSAAPAYGRAHRLAWWILRHGIEDDAMFREQQWLIPSWEVFERWCFLKVMEQVAELGGVRVSHWKIDFQSPDAAVGKLQTNGRIFELRLQDVYRALDVSRTDRASMSGERRPDITLSWNDETGMPTWITLDAKYRVGRQSVLDAMGSAHIYHHALRWQDRGPSMALLLTPAACEPGWLMDREFISRERVGVVRMNDPAGLVRVLRELL